MSYDHAKAGDRALVIGALDRSDLNGQVVTVLGDPENGVSWRGRPVVYSRVDIPIVPCPHGGFWEPVLPTMRLLPLRGDPDAKSEPRQADVPRKVTA